MKRHIDHKDLGKFISLRSLLSDRHNIYKICNVFIGAAMMILLREKMLLLLLSSHFFTVT